MNIEDYIKNRLDPEIEWYDSKSCKQQRLYKILQTIELIIAAFIPLLSGYATDYKEIAITIGLLGSIITIIEGITKLQKYHENWIQYRCTCELLKYQKYLYLTGCAPYNTDNETIDNLFIKNIENIISSENNQWKNINTIREDSKE